MDRCGDTLQQQLEAPLKWIGMYIAAASAICILAMAADIFHGFKSQKLWFPCKYFSFNATFLTLLAVAMKPPMDLSDQLYKDAGYLTKSSSLVFMVMAMAHFLSSLGAMNEQTILTNTVALGILVLTIFGNMLIQLVQLRCYFPYPYNTELFHPLMFIILLLVMLVSSAITIRNIKRSLEMKYQEMHKVALERDREIQRREQLIIANQRELMKKYWIMTETSSLQFVMARSVISTTSTLLCWLVSFIINQHFPGFTILVPIRGIVKSGTQNMFAYKWSTRWILVIQSVGVFVGLVAPTLRWFNNVSYKYSTMSFRSFKKEFKVESYWTQTLVDWRENSLGIGIRNDKCRKCFHGAKWLILYGGSVVQIVIVLACKLIVVVSVLFMTPLLACFTCVRKLRKAQQVSNVTNPNDHVGVEIDGRSTPNLSDYVIVLEGEPQLPETAVKRISHQADKMVEAGKKRQPKTLIKFLQKSGNFRGVRRFDDIQVQNLNSNCWTLPLVTLTTIAISLSNVANHKTKQLLSSVIEGMSLAKLVDEASDENGELANMRKAADAAWTAVILRHKWQDMDLRKTACDKPKVILERLSEKAESIVTEFNSEVEDIIRENPRKWPYKVINANSMYKISQYILLSIGEQYDPTSDDMFEQLSVLIADIFAACLTNLPHVISTMCHESAIEKREKSVPEAFLLLGKTERILEILHDQQHETKTAQSSTEEYIDCLSSSDE